jgi:hypothetical protein
MKKDESANRAFGFLSKHAQSGKPFTLPELIAASGWTPGNTKTNLSKRLKDLVVKKNGAYYVRPEIFRVRLNEFHDLFRQKHQLFTDYILKISHKVLVYEFFMPLSREDRLREALDNLFYEDTIKQRVREIGVAEIKRGLQLPKKVSGAQVNKLVIKLINDNIGGYSLHLVSGRFRAGELTTRKNVVERPFSAGPYLVDETTAVVRFILPVGKEQGSSTQLSFLEPTEEAKDAEEIAAQMHWLFLSFFANAVTRVVRKEDEIWLLESGMKNALYRWVREDE